MNGYFSSRWGAEHTRRITGGLLTLDVRSLKRGGALEPGTVSTVRWGDNQGIVVSTTRPGDAVTLDYRTRRYGETDWTSRTLRVGLDWTPCHFGGERVWFRCPCCQGRRAVLYSAGGVFACTKCHDLAYASTREGAVDRSTRCIRTLQRRLQAPPDCTLWHIPQKPPRMHWQTYKRLAGQLHAAILRREALLNVRFEGLMQRRDADMAWA